MLALNSSPRAAFVSAIPLHFFPSLRSRSLPLARRPGVPPKPPGRLTLLTPPTARQPFSSPPSSPIPRPSSSTLSFSSSRRLVFIGMSGMYALYVVLRGTFTYIAPVLAKSLSLSISQLGLISSAFPLLYGFSRLLTGVLADRTSPSRALGAGLLAAGVVNIAMSTSSSPALLASLWGLNGLVQGVGAGASAKILTSWHSRTERGKAWSLWSSSANIGYAARLNLLTFYPTHASLTVCIVFTSPIHFHLRARNSLYRPNFLRLARDNPLWIPRRSPRPWRIISPLRPPHHTHSARLSRRSGPHGALGRRGCP